jgi:hypothetical protein
LRNIEKKDLFCRDRAWSRNFPLRQCPSEEVVVGSLKALSEWIIGRKRFADLSGIGISLLDSNKEF